MIFFPALLFLTADFPPLLQEFPPLTEFQVLEETYDTFVGESLIGSKEWSQFLLEEDPRIDPEVLEPNWGNLLTRFVKKGTTVIDYGAKAGGRTLLFSEAVGTEGKVIAFESHPEYYRALFWNLLREKVTQTKIFCPQKIEKIEDFQLENVSLMVIDAMGKEDVVLQKSIHLINQNKPTLILNILGGIPLERGDRFIHKEFERRIAEIQKLGYTTQKIRDTWYLALPK